MPTTTESVITLEEFQRELSRLRAEFEARLATLEKRLVPAAEPLAESAPDPAPTREPVSAETIAIIAAAVTSFLGKKVKIRHARLIESGSSNWAQQGRAIIQASHNLVR